MKTKRIRILMLFSFSVLVFHPQNIDYRIDNNIMPTSSVLKNNEVPYEIQRLRDRCELIVLDIGIIKREITNNLPTK